MKRIFSLSLIIFIIFLSGCTQKIKFEYSILLDDESKQQLFDIFQAANLPIQDITQFFDFIKEYNQTSYAQSLKPGFFSATVHKQLYDYNNAINDWTKEHKENDADINCRIAAYTLINSDISMESKTINSTQHAALLRELQNEKLVLTESEKIKFSKLFSPFQLNSSSSILSSIQEKWAKEGIGFLNQSQGKLICLCVQFLENEEIQIAHTGVLFDFNDFLIFVEKTDSMMPFQMSKFKRREDLFYYLQSRFDKKPFNVVALENDVLLVD